MKLKEVRESYYTQTGAASAVSRQAAFAGIAIVWVFKHQENSSFAIPSELVFPLLMLMSSLASDLLQYIVGSIVWGTLNRIKEKELGANFSDDIYVNPKLNWPTLFFFWLKLLLVVIGYMSLVSFGLSELGLL